MDILHGKTYKTDEVGEMIDQGKLQMKLEWTEQALEAFRNLRSQHYTQFETVEYKKRLLDNIQEKVILLSTSIPVKKGEWESSYKIIVDKFIVYYLFSEK